MVVTIEEVGTLMRSERPFLLPPDVSEVESAGTCRARLGFRFKL